MISNRCQVIICRSQVSSKGMLSNKHSRYHYCITQYRKIVLIQGISTNTGKRHRYKGSIQIQENGTDTGNQYEYRKTIQLESNISKGFKFFTTIKERIIVRLLSRQAGRQVREHPSGAKQG